MAWPSSRNISGYGAGPAEPLGMELQYNNVIDEINGHIDRDNVKDNVLLGSACEQGITQTLDTLFDYTYSTEYFELRNGVLIFDEGRTDSALLDFTTYADGAVIVSGAINVSFNVTAGFDTAYVSAGIMVDGKVVARCDEEQVACTAPNAQDRHFPCKASSPLGAGPHRAVWFLQVRNSNGKSDLCFVKERRIIVEGVVR